ncbi:MAG: hypothetical protein Q8P47_00050 [Candidatus Beckwithbacteria bacterium]|nr:hypothetical protein [Candidatus Beckwithbacteria bacterium]
MDKKSLWITLGTIGLVLVPLIIYAVFATPKISSGQYDQLAQCLTDKGTKMFGAYWCSHCANQKRMFGSSFSKINYIECSLPDGKTQTEECQQAGINGYPTWEFGDGSRLDGEVSLETLAQKSGCSIEGGE